MVVGLMLTLRVWVMQVHTAIREDPAPQKKERSKPSETKNWKAKKLTYDERKQKLKVPLLPSVLPTAALCAAHCCCCLFGLQGTCLFHLRSTSICSPMVVTLLVAKEVAHISTSLLQERLQTLKEEAENEPEAAEEGGEEEEEDDE